MKHNIRSVEIEVHRDKANKITGHTVHHRYMPEKSKGSKSGAFMDYPESTSQPFGADQGKAMLAHVGKHLQLGASEPAGDAGDGAEEQDES